MRENDAKQKLVFFGSIGIARRILERLILPREDIELMGICCNPAVNPWRSEETVYEYAKRCSLPLLELEDIPVLRPDVGISVRYDKLIHEDVIRSFRLGIFNTHGGILPEYRGSYCNINALINGESEYGVTLHYIQPGVDDGDIVDIRKVPITPEDTGMDLYRTSERLCYELIRDNIEGILQGTNRRVTQEQMIREGHVCAVYKRAYTLALKDLTEVPVDDMRFIRCVRAFDSPYHEPAYMTVNGQKVYLRARYGGE